MNQWPLREMFCFAVFHYKLSCRFGHPSPKMLSFLVKVEKRKSRSLNIYLKFCSPAPSKIRNVNWLICLSFTKVSFNGVWQVQRCRQTLQQGYLSGRWRLPAFSACKIYFSRSTWWKASHFVCEVLPLTDLQTDGTLPKPINVAQQPASQLARQRKVAIVWVVG